MDEEARERHRTSDREYRRRLRESNPEILNKRMREWFHKNPERAQAHHAARRANQAARRFGLLGHLTVADVVALWERQPACVHCGTGRGLDHIVEMVVGGENVPDNLQNLCVGCNAAKETARQKAAPTCGRGHALAGRNLHLYGGRRICRACDALSMKARRADRKKAVHATT